MNIMDGENKARLILLIIVFITGQSVLTADFNSFEELRADINKQISLALELPESLTGNNVKDCKIIHGKLVKGMLFESVVDFLGKVQDKDKRMFKVSIRESGSIYFTTRMDNSKYSIEHLISISFLEKKLESINISLSFVEKGGEK